MRLVLASASPRRRDLLALLRSEFLVLPADIDESVLAGETPDAYVVRVAREKAVACTETDALILAADTTVAINDEILGKPVSSDDAARMLRLLSGSSHRVLTAIAARKNDWLESVLVVSEVQFAALSDALIAQYLRTEEPWDKAGAYGIQGFAGSFVKNISGSYSAIVGLPLCETRELLSRFDSSPAHGVGLG